MSISLHFNQERGNAIFSRDENGRIGFRMLAGPQVIEEKVNDITYRIGAGDFFQVNPAVATRLQQDVIALANQYHGHPMVDLYCGVGFFTLGLARHHSTVLGIELLAGAVERAKENASLNGLRSKFISSPVQDILPKFQNKWIHPFVIVDPARRGLESGVIEAHLSMQG